MMTALALMVTIDVRKPVPRHQIHHPQQILAEAGLCPPFPSISITCLTYAIKSTGGTYAGSFTAKSNEWIVAQPNAVCSARCSA